MIYCSKTATWTNQYVIHELQVQGAQSTIGDENMHRSNIMSKLLKP